MVFARIIVVKISSLMKVFLAMILGVIVGVWAQNDVEIFSVPLLSLFTLVGQLFLNALTLVVVPLVSSSLIIGTSRLGEDEKVGALGVRTLGIFLLTAALAVLTGIAVALSLEPGSYFESTVEKSGFEEILASSEGIFQKIQGILLRLIPSNILAVASQGQMLGLILFSFVFGFYSSRIEPEPKQVVQGFFRGVFQIMMKATHLVMRALPLGVFALMAKVAATTGYETAVSVALFFGAVLVALAIYSFVLLPLLLLISGISPLAHFRAIFPALVTAFSTSSTAATLPITLECMEKRAMIPNRFCSFILPLGTTVNLAGTALYCTAAVVFIAQATDNPLTLAHLLVVALMGLFSALGMVAAIPSASLVTVVLMLQGVGLPGEYVALILPVERLLDMCRTTTNVLTNSVSCAVAAKNLST